MDVTLPNGQVIENVPDGTTKEQLVQKLKKSGYDTSWYQSSEPSILQKGAGLAEALVEMPVKALVGGGALAGAGLTGLAAGESPEEAAKSGARASAKATDWSLFEQTPKWEEKLGNIYEGWFRTPAGEINAADVARYNPNVPGSEKWLNAENKMRALGEGSADLIAYLSMLKPSRTGQSFKERKAAERAAAEKLLKEALNKRQIESGLEPKRPVGPGPIEFDTPGSTPLYEAPLDVRQPGDIVSTSPGAAPFTPRSPVEARPDLQVGTQRGRPYVVPQEPAVDPYGVSNVGPRSALEPNLFDTAEQANAIHGLGGDWVPTMNKDVLTRLEMEQATRGPNRELPEPGRVLDNVNDLVKSERPDFNEPVWPTELPKEKVISGSERLGEIPPEQTRSPLRPELSPVFLENARKLQGGMFDPSILFEPADKFFKKLAALPNIRKLIDRLDGGVALPIEERLSNILADNREQRAIERLTKFDVRTAPLDERMAVSEQFHVEWKAREDLIEDLTRALGRGEEPVGISAKLNLEGLRKKQGGAIYPFADFKRDLKAQGVKLPDRVARAIWEKEQKEAQPTPKTSGHPDEAKLNVIEKTSGLKKIREEMFDDRSWEELPIDPDKDMTPFQANVSRKITSGLYAAKDNPIVSKTSSEISRIKGEAEDGANAIMHGKSAKNPDPGTYNHAWKLLKFKERRDVNKVGQALNNERTWLGDGGIQAKARELLGRELTSLELQSYLDRVRINKQVWGMINKELIANGKDPVGELPHFWSPAEFDGPFLTTFRKEGEVPIVVPSYLKPTKRQLQRLQEQFPDYTIDPEIRERTLGKDFDLDQYIRIMQSMSEPTRSRVASDIREAFRRRGLMRHGLRRKGAKGAMGTTETSFLERAGIAEEGSKATHNYEEIAERYIRSMFEYVSNRKLDKLFNELSNFEGAKKNPMARAYSLEAIDQARGGSNIGFEKFSAWTANFISGAIKQGTFGQVELPQVFVRDLQDKTNRAAVTMILGFGFLPQIGIQGFQPLYAIPKMMDMGAKNNWSAAKTDQAIMQATSRAMNKYVTEPKHPDILKLKELGAFESVFHYEAANYRGNRLRDVQKTTTDHLTGLSTLEFVESNAVRRPAALMYLELLREMDYDSVAKSPDEIYKAAKYLTDKYMVTNKWYHKPAAIMRSGIVGQALGTLMNFPTTWLAQLMEYSKTAASKPTSLAHLQPIVAFMALNGLFAGAMGIFGGREYDEFANIMNTKFGTKLPTYAEFVFQLSGNDSVRYGVLSSLLGVNIGASMNAPTITGTFAAGLQLIYNVMRLPLYLARLVGALGEKNKPTDVEIREMMKDLAPRVLHGWIEREYTPEGAPYQKSTGTAGIERDVKDWTARLFGTYTLKEVNEKAAESIAARKGTYRALALTKAMNRVGDALLNNEEDPTPIIEFAVERLTEEGYSSREIKDAFRNELLSKLLTSKERRLGRGTTSRQQFFYELYQSLGEEE